LDLITQLHADRGADESRGSRPVLGEPDWATHLGGTLFEGRSYPDTPAPAIISIKKLSRDSSERRQALIKALGLGQK